MKPELTEFISRAEKHHTNKNAVLHSQFEGAVSVRLVKNLTQATKFFIPTVYQSRGTKSASRKVCAAWL